MPESINSVANRNGKVKEIPYHAIAKYRGVSPVVEGWMGPPTSPEERTTHILNCLNLCHKPGELILATIFFEAAKPRYAKDDRQRTFTGFFESSKRRDLAKALSAMSEGTQGPGSGGTKGQFGEEISKPLAFYFNLNPIHESCICTSPNKFDWGISTLANGDVTRRQRLLIDLDPCRRPKTSSSEPELAEAKELRDEMVDYFAASGWFDRMILGCSGNGYYVLGDREFPGPPDKHDDQVKGQLQFLNATFGTETVKVDTAVSNAARIVRLLGTPNRKGFEYGDRRHRDSYVEGVVS